MKYCRQTTENLPISNSYNCLVDLNALILNEGYVGSNNVFENNEVVLNLDSVERDIAVEQNRLRNKSMDSAFCIKKDTSEQIVLVEYKFNHADFKYLTKSSMEEKVSGSIAVLGDGTPIHYQYYFIVQQNLVNQAYRRFYLMNPKLDNRFVPLCIHSLKSIFF